MKKQKSQIFYQVHPSSSDLYVGRESNSFPLVWLIGAVALIVLAILVAR